MEDKYYVPEIEEFHVGCEIYMPMEGQEELVCSVLNDPNLTSVLNVHISDNESFEKYSVPDCLKMKYLDQDDIESFGFNKHTFSSKWYNVWIKGQFDPNNWDKNKDALFLQFMGDYHTTRSIVITTPHGKANLQTGLYRGVCKNKSKLKTLLKDLGV